MKIEFHGPAICDFSKMDKNGDIEVPEGTTVKTGASFTEDSALEYRINELKEQMQVAINQQNFEEAARLRDEIRNLGGDSSNG